eukprot:CAMPEP_0179057102 /NCGR_PEP_ID=MMETSP0796-20121207/24157_1 /TAXON_ID=73915 /ORGANISM="Pyrodinium bahamense, Strain pbaha01" /LENGTH=417 /DNA_ID=CAMNT_0020753803 /DNA_START=30 /DNA_END=1283 /DNA_ORIENTATION=+
MAQNFHSRCIQKSVRSIADAISEFSAKNDRGEVPLVLIPAHRDSTNWWMTIPTGCYCLMQRFGKDVGIAPPGGSITPPFYRIAYIVSSQSCTYNAPVKECPTKDNVRVEIDVVLVFNIRSPQDFVYKLGAVRFDQLLSGAVDEAIRVLVRNQSHGTVRMLRGSRSEALLTTLNKKFNDAGVTFSNCTVTRVILPAELETSLERTTELRKAMEKAKREHEYQLGEIQRKCDMDLEELNRKNEQTIVMEQGRKKRAELNHEQLSVKAAELTSTALIEAEQKFQVKKMQVTAELERTKVEVEQKRLETISRAEADAEARRVQADIAYEKALMTAQAEKERLEGEGEAIKLDAKAEAEATQHLMHKRRHELDMREKDVIMKLASKSDYNLIGTPGDTLVGAVMAGSLDAARERRTQTDDDV